MRGEPTGEPVAFGVPYPAHTPAPDASPGMAVHSYLVFSGYSGTDAHCRCNAARDDNERRRALSEMPDARVTFYELP